MTPPTSPHSGGAAASESSAHAPALPPPAKGLWLEDWLTVCIMALLALITFANVLVRYFTDGSFAWTEEISVFLMILLAMVAGSAAVARDLHIRIEYFCQRGSASRRKALARFGSLMVALLFAVICVLSVRVVWDDYRYEETSPGIGLPQWWYSIWLPVFSALITVRALGLCMRQGKATFEEVPDDTGEGTVTTKEIA